MEEQPLYGNKKESISIVDFDHYRQITPLFNTYKANDMEYSLCSGIYSETGELVGRFNKVLRDNNGLIDKSTELGIIYEIGDVLWYLSELSNLKKIEFETLGNNPLNNGSIFYNALNLRKPINNLIDATIKSNSNYLNDEHFHEVYCDIWQICYQLKIHVVDVLQLNIDKLTDRKNRNVIKGSGDNR